MSCLFDSPPTLESLLARIEALEAKVMEKPVRQSTEVPDELRQAWSLWTLHKSGSKGWTAIAKQRQIAKLAELAGRDGALAMRIVETSIERGWTTFYLPKDDPKPKVVPTQRTVKQAMQPTETPLERDIARARHDYHYGVIDEAERDRRIQEATHRHRRKG